MRDADSAALSSTRQSPRRPDMLFENADIVNMLRGNQTVLTGSFAQDEPSHEVIVSRRLVLAPSSRTPDSQIPIEKRVQYHDDPSVKTSGRCRHHYDL